jgi:hypothetical protein
MAGIEPASIVAVVESVGRVGQKVGQNIATFIMVLRGY